MKVSVPYRGATVLNFERNYYEGKKVLESFPSPIGELHFSIVIPSTEGQR